MTTVHDIATDEPLRFAVGASSLGPVLVATGAGGVRAILFGDDPGALPGALRERFPGADAEPGDERLAPTLGAVLALIDDPARGLDLPLDPAGTAFQHRVWRALRDIPVGATASYSAVAASIGAPGEALAVADACAANPLAVAIPCHRVVRKDGRLAGYRWGFRRKRALLAREAAGQGRAQ